MAVVDSCSPEQQEGAQPPQNPGRGRRLPGNGKGKFYGPIARLGRYRRYITAKDPEEEGGWYYDPKNWPYYRDEDGRWWYLNDGGQLFAEQGRVAVDFDRRGYYTEGDGRQWYRDDDGKWWAEHDGELPVKEAEDGATSKKTLESDGKFTTEQGATENAEINGEKKKKNNKSKKSKENFFKKEPQREDFAKTMTLLEYEKVRQDKQEKGKAFEVMKAIREVNKTQFDGMQVVVKSKKLEETRFIKHEDKKKVSTQVVSINEILKFNYAPRDVANRGGYRGDHSSGHVPDGRYSGRFSNNIGPTNRGDRRSNNANSVVQSLSIGHVASTNRLVIRFCDPNSNENRRIDNADKELKRPVTPYVQLVPPPRVEDLQQFPALCRVSKS